MTRSLSCRAGSVNHWGNLVCTLKYKWVTRPSCKLRKEGKTEDVLSVKEFFFHSPSLFRHCPAAHSQQRRWVSWLTSTERLQVSEALTLMQIVARLFLISVMKHVNAESDQVLHWSYSTCIYSHVAIGCVMLWTRAERLGVRGPRRDVSL